MRAAILAGQLMALTVVSNAEGLIRGPYLVDASSVSARACWRDAAGDECRAFSGLLPGATFVYSVPGSTVSWTAKTLPGPSGPLRFAIFGDSGKGTKDQFKVAGLLTGYDPDLVLVLGDIIYPRGSDKDYDPKYFRPYAASVARAPFFPCPGNHDYGNYHAADKGQRRFEEAYARVHRRPKYYSFDAGPAHFVSLDDNAAYDIPAAEPIGPASEQVRWLEEDLSRSKARWKFVYLHIPLYDTIAFHGDSASLRKTLEPLFQRYHVDAVFQGHEHVYQRSRSLGGVVYITVGTGGAGLHWVTPKGDWLETEYNGYGFATAALDEHKFQTEFIDEDGQVQDRFSIEKP